MPVVEWNAATDKAVIIFNSGAVGRSGRLDAATESKPAVAVKVSRG